MKDVKAVRGRYYIQRLVEQGEHVNQDFKYLINDARKIARSVSAFANNSGGRLLIGVKDNGVIAGVRNEEDIYVVEQAASMYCHPACHVDFKAYNVDYGVIVICAEIQRATHRPVMVDEGGGVTKAYYRVKDENITAHPLMVEAWRLRDNPGYEPLYYSADDFVTSILDTLTDRAMSIEQLAREIHASMRSVEDAVTRLAAMDMIDFIFDGDRFMLTRQV